jgi:hypothetical protein
MVGVEVAVAVRVCVEVVVAVDVLVSLMNAVAVYVAVPADWASGCCTCASGNDAQAPGNAANKENKPKNTIRFIIESNSIISSRSRIGARGRNIDNRTNILYNKNMLSTTPLTAGILPAPHSGQAQMIVAPHAARGMMLELAAQLALRGLVRVLDGGNHFNAYLVSRSLRRNTAELEAALGRITLARAFTCYQMEAMLDQAARNPFVPSSGNLAAPAVLVLDFLSTFCDENVAMFERRRLLVQSKRWFQLLAGRGPLVVSLSPVRADKTEPAELLESLLESAGQVLRLESPAQVTSPRLFE